MGRGCFDLRREGLSIPDKNDFMKKYEWAGMAAGRKEILRPRAIKWMDRLRLLLLLGLALGLLLPCHGQAGGGQPHVPASAARILLRCDTVQGLARQRVLAAIPLDLGWKVAGIRGSLRLETGGEGGIVPLGWSSSFDTVEGDVRVQSMVPMVYRLPFACHQQFGAIDGDSAWVAFDFFTQDGQPLENAVVEMDGIILVDLIEGKWDAGQAVEAGGAVMHPNPVLNRLTVQLQGADEAIDQLEVWDMSGRLLLRQACGASLHVLDLQSLEAGRYLLRGCGAGRVLRRWPFVKL